MDSIINLRLFYKKGIHFELYDSAYANLGGDLENHRFTSNYIFLYGSGCISLGIVKNNNQSLFLQSMKNAKLLYLLLKTVYD